MSPQEDGHVVIFKSISETEGDDRDAYGEILRSAGFQVTLIPVIDFEFVNIDELLMKIKKPDNYAGCIFSSPRCVTAFHLAVEREHCVIEKWKCLKHFAVGEKTAKMVDDLGLLAEGKEAGNGDKLADIIIRDKYEKPFLYPIGSLTLKNLKLKLNENGVDVDETLVYITKPHPSLECNITKVKSHLREATDNYFIYFSPSGINFSLPILKKLEINLEFIKFVMIGPTTEAAAVQSGLTVAKTAAKPNPSAVLNAIMELKKS